MKITVTVLLAILGLMSQAASSQEVQNSDVYGLMTELADEIELIREMMGRPFDDRGRLPVAAVTDDELYFQTQILFVAANRLASELAGGDLLYPPPPPREQIVPADTLRLVEAAHEDIHKVSEALGIVEPVQRQDRSTPIAATGVLSLVLDVNRQIDLLLEREFSSADVHRRLTVAVTQAAGILAGRGLPSPVPDDLGQPRLPADVYRSLLETLELVTRVAGQMGIDTLAVGLRRNIPSDVRPSDVYHLAQFLVADLSAIARASGTEPVAVELGTVPEHIFPVHTYRLAQMLAHQIEVFSTVH